VGEILKVCLRNQWLVPDTLSEIRKRTKCVPLDRFQRLNGTPNE